MAAGKNRRRKERRAWKARHEAQQAVVRAETPVAVRCAVTDISGLVVSPEDVVRAGVASEPTKWIVVSCAPMGERKAMASLRERRLWAYLPMQRFCRYSHGHKQVVERPLMVGYLFAILPKGWHPDDMKDIAGIDGVLKSNGRAAEINPWTLVQLGALEASGVFDHSGETKSLFAEGQQVKVTGGQFIGWLATVVTVSGEQIRIEMDGQFRGTFPIKQDHLAPVDEKEAA